MKDEYVIIASPLITICPFSLISKGRFKIPFAKCVIFVPTYPLPLVTIFVNLPLSYVATNVQPSSFHDTLISLYSVHLITLDIFLLLASDKAGNSCSSFIPSIVSITSDPTYSVGLFSGIYPVCSCKSDNSSYNLS